MLLTGLLQGRLVLYLLMALTGTTNSDWLFYGMPATMALSSMLLLTVVALLNGARCGAGWG